MIETARRFSKALSPGDLDQKLSTITAATIEVLPGIDNASIAVNDQRAFAFLTRMSQHRNVKLRRIAEGINDTVQPQGNE